MFNIKKCIVYDVEIAKEVNSTPKGWNSPEDLGFASAVAYDYATDQYYFFLHDEGRQDLIDLLHGKRAITFNGIKFDSRVVLGNDRCSDRNGRTGLKQTWWWENIDLLLEYIKARFDYNNVAEAEARLGDKTIHDGTFGLDGLAEGTLGLNKTGHGAKAPLLYQQRKYAELLAYNLQDVRLTRKLFDFVRVYGYLIDRLGRAVKIPIDYIS